MFLTAQSTQSPRSDDSKGGWGSEAVSPMLSQGTRMTFGQMQPPRPLPTASTGTTYVQVSEALDAGRVVAREEVPPRYNPAWADEDTPHAL
jgi:hypothetical protein